MDAKKLQDALARAADAVTKNEKGLLAEALYDASIACADTMQPPAPAAPADPPSA